MNRNLILIAIAAVVIAGIGVGLLLPALNSGPLAGSIAPTTTEPPLVDITVTFTPTPTPVQPVVITITGSYSPVKKSNGYWYWHLKSVTDYDATSLPVGVVLESVYWSITGLDEDGKETERVRDIAVPEAVPMAGEGGSAPTSGWIPLAQTWTLDDANTDTGCTGANLCAQSQMWFKPPFNASCTIRASDGNSYTKTVMLPPESWTGYGF